MAGCFVAAAEVECGAAVASNPGGLPNIGSEAGGAGAGLDAPEESRTAQVLRGVELFVSDGSIGTARVPTDASNSIIDLQPEQIFQSREAQAHAIPSGSLPESAGQAKCNHLGAGSQSDEGCQLSKPKPGVLPDTIPVRPCRSSARVSEKERRELENAAREQSQTFDQDSRESKERGRKDSKSAPKTSKSAVTAPQDEAHPVAAEGRLEKQAEEDEGKKQMAIEGVLLSGDRSDAVKQAPTGKEAVGAEKEKDFVKAGSGDTAVEKTKKAAYWTHEEEEAFFSSLRQCGKNFEKIQAKVKSKDKEQVRHYYYRCIKRMNKLLQPGMVLDISNPLVVNTAMLRWWQVRADVKGDITDLHRKPRKHKQFQTAFEKAITADLHRKSKARKKQAANPVQPAAGAAAAPQAEASSGPLPGSDPRSASGQPGPPASGSGSSIPEVMPSGKPDSSKAQTGPFPNNSAAHLGTGKKNEAEAFGSKTGAQQSKLKDTGGKVARAGGKARAAPAAGQALMGKKKGLPGKGIPKAKSSYQQKGDGAGRQQTAGGKKAVGPKPGTKRGRADVKDKAGKSDSSAKRPKGRGKGAGEVINDVGSVSEASLASSRGPGRPRKAAVENGGGEQASKASSLDGLAAAAAHLEKLEAGQREMAAEKGRGPPGTGGLPAEGHVVGVHAAGGDARAVRGQGNAAGKDEGQPAGKLTLQLFPFDAETEERVKKAGFVPFIELTLKSKKSLASIAQHLVSKWNLDQPLDLQSAPPASSLAGCTLRLIPNIDRGEALSALSWGVTDKSVAAAEVFALVGKPEIFRLKYRLLPPNCPLPVTAQAHSQGPPFDQAVPQQPGPGPWQGHPGLPHSPLRPPGLNAAQYASTVSRGAWPPCGAAEQLPHRTYRTVSPHLQSASPLRGPAAADAGSQRAFSWAADASVEALGRGWEPPPPRYMPVSNSAPLGRGPGANDGAAFGDSLDQAMFGGRGGGEHAGMPVGGNGWLDDVEGFSISGFLNADGSRGPASSPFLDGHRSRSSLGLGSPPFSPPLWSPDQDDFLLRAPASLEIPFGDSLLLRSLESSNDGFLPATREVSKSLGRQGSARRASSSGLGRSRSSGDLVSPAKGKRATSSETGVEDAEAEPGGCNVRPSSPQPRPSSGTARAKGAESTAPGGQPCGEGAAQGPSAEGSRPRRRSPSTGAGSQFQLSKAVLSEQPRTQEAAGTGAAALASKPFMALFPSLPGQLTQEELLSAQEGGPESTTPAPPTSRGASPSSDGDAQVRAPDEQDQAEERAPKRKARAKPRSDGRSKLQKSQAQPGKRAADLSQANKAAAAALSSCFGKSPFARSSWQNAS
ncbi:myb/SANT domain protein [Klebsormidium nitens]|uniref:Myb/SANT domain protein n=1 Tax=Klebsormidium nitens TaxID=105231 RepID=A0A1Y1IEY6_KLENI|nr:myb/SANT domain protein [Klebsormidium nitens]|eukprot:GAQ87326.1 myb/SANT domain protein [Klebsormidium nitens]